MRPLTPLVLVVAIGQLLMVECMVPLKGQKKNPKNATEPLVYKRLRFDQDSLQTLRRYQKYLTEDEHQIRFQFNETLQADEDNPSNRTNLVEYSYYQNDQVEATSINYDTLIFEAIDRSYFTRIIQYFIHSYDNVDEISKASDKNVVSRSRCDKEMDYMMRQLAELEHARLSLNSGASLRMSNALNADFLTLMDSFGTEQPGLLMGNLFWLGNWRHCKRSRVFYRDPLEPEKSVDFRSRHCIASLRSKHWDELVKERLSELNSMKHFRKDSERNSYARHHRIQIGVCLPESCDTRLKWRRRDQLQQLAVYKLSEPLRSYELMDFYCLPDENSELRELEPSAICFIIVLVLWCGLVIAATVGDVRARRLRNRDLQRARPALASTCVATDDRKRAKSLSEKLIDCLSYLRNLERLFETSTCNLRHETARDSAAPKMLSNDRFSRETLMIRPTDGVELRVDRLQFINSIKVLATLSIVLGHVGMVFVHIGKFTLDYDGVNELLTHFMYSSTLLVDWYFVMSGFLVAYTAFLYGRVERHSSWSWLGTIVHRYLRLAPCYLLVFWFAKSISIYLNAGPLWDYGTTNATLRSPCRSESIIWPLTLTSNLHPVYEECIMPSWYISSDFQFFLLTPFLLTLLHKWPKLAWCVSLATIGASVGARLHRYLTDPRVKMLEMLRPKHDMYVRSMWDVYSTYLFPQYRVGSYLLGLLAGHYVYMVLTGRWRSSLLMADDGAGQSTESPAKRDSRQFRRQTTRWILNINKDKLILMISWIFSLSAMSNVLLGTWIMFNFYPTKLESYADEIGAVIYANCHVFVAASFALFTILMTLGNYSSIRYFLSLPFWTVLSRLNFLIYIGQIEVIILVSGAGGDLPEMNTIEILKYYLQLLAWLYLLAGLLVPLIEMPLSQLERTFIRPLFKPPQLVQSIDRTENNPRHVQLSSGPTQTRASPLASRKDSIQAYELKKMAPDESAHLVKVGQSGDPGRTDE